MNKSSISEKVFRACLSTYIVFGVIFGGLASLLILSIVIRGANRSVWSALSLIVGIWAFVFYSIARFRLVLGPESVTYSSLFTREITIQRSDVVHADFAKKTGPYESPFTFVVRTKDGVEVRINAKVFSLEAVRELCKLCEGIATRRHSTRGEKRKKRTRPD